MLMIRIRFLFLLFRLLKVSPRFGWTGGGKAVLYTMVTWPYIRTNTATRRSSLPGGLPTCRQAWIRNSGITSQLKKKGMGKIWVCSANSVCQQPSCSQSSKDSSLEVIFLRKTQVSLIATCPVHLLHSLPSCMIPHKSCNDIPPTMNLSHPWCPHIPWTFAFPPYNTTLRSHVIRTVLLWSVLIHKWRYFKAKLCINRQLNKFKGLVKSLKRKNDSKNPLN